MLEDENTQEECFDHVDENMNKKTKRHVKEYAMRRPYYGTYQDKELRDAKNRARAHGHRDD